MSVPMSDRIFQEYVPAFMLNGAEAIVYAASLISDPEKAHGILVELRDLLDSYSDHSPEFADMSRDIRDRVATLLREDQS